MTITCLGLQLKNKQPDRTSKDQLNKINLLAADLLLSAIVA